ncbi:MAG: hypothetical protein IJZ75_01760 [Clostridia bacterium]|nr:hypothetical protein [Clostridia bacterium]
MKRIEKASELMWVLGIIFVALGVSICNKADLGVSMIAAPAFIVSESALNLWSGFDVGVTEYLLQGLILIAMCLIIKKFNWRYLLAFAVAVIYGYTLNLFLWLLGGITLNAVWLRWVTLIIGDVFTAFGVACFFRTYMPLQVHELFVAELCTKFNLNISKVKSAFDISLLMISLLLALTLFGDVGEFDWSTIGYSSFHSIGLGTIVTTLINSPLISLMGRLLDKLFGREPYFTNLKQILKRS